MTPAKQMALATAGVGVLLLAIGLAVIERGQPVTPWTEPLPAYAVSEGYNDFREAGVGWAVPGYAAWRMERDPPRGDGPLIIDQVHASKQPYDSHMGPTDYRYDQMFGLGRAFEPVRQAGVPLQVEDRRISPSVLAGASSLFINLPSGDNAPFLHDEVEAIDAFVRAGGGLVLVVDHSDCYFHAEQLLPLTSRLGIELPPVTACDIPPATLSPKTRAWLHVTDVPEHPVTRGVDALGVATAAEVLGPEDWTTLMWTGASGWADIWEPYLRPDSAGLTGDLEQHEGEDSRPVAMAVAGQHGKGRVVVLGDQNMLGSALIGIEDNQRLFANAIGWSIGLDMPVSIRGLGSVTTLTGEDNLCSASVPKGYRTLQVQLMRLARFHLMPEYCTRVGPVESERLVVLPQAMHPELVSLVEGAERVLVIVDGPLAETLGLELGERVQTLGFEGELERPFPDHPVWTAEHAPVPVNAFGYTGGEVLLSSEGRPLLVRDGNLLLLLDPDLLTNEGMGNERARPDKDPERAARHGLALSLMALLTE
jgi:hypothetical protein